MSVVAASDRQCHQWRSLGSVMTLASQELDDVGRPDPYGAAATTANIVRRIEN